MTVAHSAVSKDTTRAITIAQRAGDSSGFTSPAFLSFSLLSQQGVTSFLTFPFQCFWIILYLFFHFITSNFTSPFPPSAFSSLLLHLLARSLPQDSFGIFLPPKQEFVNSSMSFVRSAATVYLILCRSNQKCSPEFKEGENICRCE